MPKTKAPKKLFKQENGFNKASASVELKVLNSSPFLSMDFDLRGLLRRVVEEVEAEIRQVEKELAEVERRARRGGAETRAGELDAVRDILYEDRWFRVATAVYAQVKRQFAEDAEAGEVIEAAKSNLFGLRWWRRLC